MNIAKFNIADKVITINVGYKLPFTREFEITGIAIKDGEPFYINPDIGWVPESAVFASRREAYNYIISQCESELVRLAHVKRFVHPKVEEYMARQEKEKQEAEKMEANA